MKLFSILIAGRKVASTASLMEYDGRILRLSTKLVELLTAVARSVMRLGTTPRYSSTSLQTLPRPKHSTHPWNLSSQQLPK